MDFNKPSDTGLYTSDLDNLIGYFAAKHTDIPIDLKFINESDEHIKYFWIDHNGKQIITGVLKPGFSKTKKTFAKHPWLLEREDKIKICVFDPPKAFIPNSNVNLTIKSDFSVTVSMLDKEATKIISQEESYLDNQNKN